MSGELARTCTQPRLTGDVTILRQTFQQLTCCHIMNRSPVTVRRADSKGKVTTLSTSSPEKSPAKLPPRNPRRSPSKTSGFSVNTLTSSRHSSSSPEKMRSKGQMEDNFLDRVKSSSPSPVRSAAPVPVPASPSHSLDYSSSFASPPVSSSSSHASPLKSPVKSDSSIKIVNNSSQSPAAAPKSPKKSAKKSLDEPSATSCRDQNIVETNFSRSTLNVDPKPESPVSSIYTEEEISEASGWWIYFLSVFVSVRSPGRDNFESVSVWDLIYLIHSFYPSIL